MTSPSSAPSSPDAAAPPSRRRWLTLVIVGLAQLMVVLDATVVNIALPSAQADLGFSDGDRQWIVTAYSLPFVRSEDRLVRQECVSTCETRWSPSHLKKKYKTR